MQPAEGRDDLGDTRRAWPHGGNLSRLGSARGLAGVCDEPMEYSLDVVAVAIDDERREVPTAVLRSQARWAIVGAAVAQRSFVPTYYRVFARRSEGDVCASGHSISTRFVADSVNAEVVTLVAAEQDVGVSLKLAFS